MRGRVVVVGLGPAGVDLMLPVARAALERVAVRYARTARHPAVAELHAAGIPMAALDHHYDDAPDLDAAYAGIVAELAAAAAEHGEVAYAVPGSPATAERTPAMLRAAGLAVEVVPGMSFAELAWVRLGVDPLDGARVVDGRRFDVDAAGTGGPLLVAQCDSRLVLSEVKLVLLEHLDGSTPVTVLSRLGLADESIVEVPLEDLDRSVEPDHLTAVFVDTGDVRVAGELAALHALVERLRGPGGCPWDAAQTHRSLARHTLEEAYEVVEAIERLPVDAPGGEPAEPRHYAALADELGDLLFQVLVHAVLAAEAGAFTVADVARGIHDKLVRRHPHVFGTATATSADEVVASWEQIKRAESGRGSLVEGITAGLPALLLAAKLVRKAEAVGLVADDVVAGPAAAAAALRGLATDDGLGGDELEAVVGDVLAAVAVAARARGVDPEVALAGWAARLRDRFRAVEREADRRGVDLTTAPPDRVRALWTSLAPHPH